MLENVLAVGIDDLVRETAGLKLAGHRFVTLSCTAMDDGQFDILYHFELGQTLKHLRLKTGQNKSVPSISSVFFAAFLVENEIQDLFGIRFEGLAIDYKGTLYLDRTSPLAPFCTSPAPSSGVLASPILSSGGRTAHGQLESRGTDTGKEV